MSGTCPSHLRAAQQTVTALPDDSACLTTALAIFDFFQPFLKLRVLPIYLPIREYDTLLHKHPNGFV